MILELSTKCAPSEAFQVAAETRAFLIQNGVDPSGDQETKTKKALRFFSKQLQTAAERRNRPGPGSRTGTPADWPFRLGDPPACAYEPGTSVIVTT